MMDVHMPRKDGLEACRAIRAREMAADGRPRTPIVAVTASVLAHETRAYFEAGMDDIVPKPIDLQRLVAVLRARLDQPAVEAAATGHPAPISARYAPSRVAARSAPAA